MRNEKTRKTEELYEEIKHALAKFLSENPGIKRSVVINAYLDKKISLSKAAEELGLHPLEIERQFMAEGIPIRRISKDDLIAEAQAVTKWE